MKVSYRVSLFVAIPVLVLVTGGIITVRSFTATRANIEALAEDLFREVSAETANRTRHHAEQVVPTLDLLTLLARDGLALDDSDELARQLTGVLRANPGYTWVSYSDEHGAFTGAYRATHDGTVTIRVNQSHLEDGKTRLVEHDVADDGRWTVYRREEDTGYDPRRRPFYVAAREARRRVWLPPYVFFEQGVPGVTCAQPVYAADGALRGVFTVDFDLNALSEFVGTLHLSEHSRVFLFTPEGALLAHPTERLVTTAGHRDEGQLLALRDVDDDAARAFAGTLRDEDRRVVGHAEHTRHFVFRVHGENWYGSVTAFRVDEGLEWMVGAVAPEDDFLGVVRANNYVSLAVSVAALLIALVVSSLLAGRVAGPLAALSTEMARVGRFELDGAPPKPSVFREIDAMNASLQGMKGGLKSFASYVPRDVVRAVLASGDEAKLGGTVRTLTMFFSDVAGFTTLSESVAPDVLVEMLSGYLDAMTRVITEHGGTVDKFIGDGIMAFWGAPAADEHHAARACEAAVRCQRKLAALRETEPYAWMRTAETRIGIATGDVLVGNIGTPDRLNYTVMGDIVNLAARLEGQNKSYGTPILVSEATYLQAKDRVVGRAIDVVAVKGKAQGVKVFALVGLRDEEDAARDTIVALSNEALDRYLARDFEGASRAWGELLAAHPDDSAARVMKERADAFRDTPPPDDWDGVYISKTK